MMRRYRRKSRSYRMKFQWFFDLSTIPDEMQILTVSAGGEYVKQRLRQFFGAFKYYRLGQIRLKMVPASTLPVDPNGLSYKAGDNLVDPRDQLTPGLTRITNGEDMFEDLTGVSADDQRKIYATMMMDRRWFKWQLQSGLSRKASPRYWQIGQLHQDYFPGSTINEPGFSTAAVALGIGANATYHVNVAEQEESLVAKRFTDGPGSSKYGLFQTGHKGRLGWMPTDALIKSISENGVLKVPETPASAAVPEVECFKIILPPAFKTRYYYRCFVTETVYFRGAITNDCLWADEDDASIYGESFQSLDRFVRSTPMDPMFPTVARAYVHTTPYPNNDGGKGEIMEYPIPPEPDPDGDD